jgi:4-amino-4-deoxy-L-arabinose transferase-like glycosyltransferase
LQSSSENKISPQIRRVSFAAVVFVCLFGNLGAFGLVGPDEPRYVWIARAMAQTGDWVTPHLYGQPWFEKPILYYWLAGIGFLLHLPAEYAARLPSAFAALAAAAAVAVLAARFYKGTTSSIGHPKFLAPLLFATTVGAIGFARAATPDMLFSSFIALSMAAAAEILRRNQILGDQPPAAQRSDRIPLALFGAFLGVAVLAKGPAAVILSGGALLLWCAASRHWHALLRFFHPFALAAFCLTALPWYVLCALRNPEFLHVFIFQHNFERYLTPVFQHPQPFWFFLPITLLALLPWTVFLLPVAQDGLRLAREESWHKSPGFFFACWAVFPIVFFSFSQSKLPSYILPAIPPLTLIVAISLHRMFTNRQCLQRAALMATATWLILGIGALAAIHFIPPVQRDALRTPMIVVGFIAIAGAAIIFWHSRHRAEEMVSAAILLPALLVFVVSVTVLPRLDPFISARWHAQFMRNDRHSDRIFAYHLPRAWSYGLAFYLGRELPEWSAADPDPALILTTPRGLTEIRQLHRFSGDLQENYQGILYVPILPLSRSFNPAAH